MHGGVGWSGVRIHVVALLGWGGVEKGWSKERLRGRVMRLVSGGGAVTGWLGGAVENAVFSV